MYLKSSSIILKVLIISLLIFLLGGCEDDLKEEIKSGDKNIPDEQSDSVRVITMDGETISMEMHARHIDRYYKRKETFIDSLYLQNFNED